MENQLQPLQEAAGRLGLCVAIPDRFARIGSPSTKMSVRVSPVAVIEG